jgi:hypothetical protein
MSIVVGWRAAAQAGLAIPDVALTPTPLAIQDAAFCIEVCGACPAQKPR